MSWSDFYLICFGVGFLLSLISFVSGATNWHLHLPHFPHFHGGGGHIPVGHGGIVHGPTAHGPVAHGGASPPGTAGGHGPQSTQISPFNFITLTAFLAWFGGTGYLVTRFSSVWFALGLLIATGAGLVGAGIVFLFLSRVLISDEEALDPADYEMVGVLGRTSIPIRQGGTGEIIYAQAGTRRTCGARSDDGQAIGKGIEIVVTRYDKGIAYVRLWEEMSRE